MNKEELEEFILLIEDRIERVHLSSFTDKLLTLKELAILGLEYKENINNPVLHNLHNTCTCLSCTKGRNILLGSFVKYD